MHENTPEESRWLELARRANSRCCYTYTEFLTLAEQEDLARLPWPGDCAPRRFWGGWAGAERKLACFGSPELCGYEEDPPLVCLEIAPKAEKFAEPLTHRDFLGALMSLGLRRSVLGDILLENGRAYLFCLDNLADFILRELTQVRRTAVVCARLDRLPEEAATLPDPVQVLVASERLDGVVAAVYHLSRSASQQLIQQGRVQINDREALSANAALHSGDRVSVRGYGRFFYEGDGQATRKGRLRVWVRVF